MYENETDYSDARYICLELDINNNRSTSTQRGHPAEDSDEYEDTVVESPSQQKRKRSPSETVKTRKPKCRSSWKCLREYVRKTKNNFNFRKLDFKTK
jgi:hypothetical protein